MGVLTRVKAIPLGTFRYIFLAEKLKMMPLQSLTQNRDLKFIKIRFQIPMQKLILHIIIKETH